MELTTEPSEANRTRRVDEYSERLRREMPGAQCEWTAPEPRSMTPDEVRRLARELARGIGRIVIAYSRPRVDETIDGAPVAVTEPSESEAE